MSAIKLTIMAIVVAAFVAICKGKMAFKEQCLYWHNYFRTLHQVPPVTWSMGLQKEAEEWVKYLAENNKFQHSQHNRGNLFITEHIPKEYCSDAIWWFHWEEKYYDYSNPHYSRYTTRFTQVVWRSSKEIGAAWALRKDGKLVVSIKYKPGGNYPRFFANNVFRPIARVLGGWKVQPPNFTLCPEGSEKRPSSAAPVPGKWHPAFRFSF
ncbi:Golgi-associated plant pathogenesis-related protein 1-like [Acropora millepora]|uniref:Golgi-associated plant pathogenesis-related protein 1-like n=1 Tax=Acropora millepora TaxID=45264 RepID=UPI001CF133EF|nr:Golgi-associated plant pathogenesis-related protein 1-like [Acropora millepora]